MLVRLRNSGVIGGICLAVVLSSTSAVIAAEPAIMPGVTQTTSSAGLPTESAAAMNVPALQAADKVSSTSLPSVAELESWIPEEKRDILTIDLPRVVARSVCFNLGVKIKDLDMKIAHDEFHAQQGIFDLNISASIGKQKTETLSLLEKTDTTIFKGDTFIRNQRQDSSSLQAGLSQLLPNGAIVSLLFTDTKNHTDSAGYVSPYWGATTSLQVTQPLLKGAGFLVTQANIVIAEYNSYSTVASYKQEIMEQVSTALQSYYDLIFAVGTVEVVQVSLEQAKELLRINKAKLDAGVLPELDVLQAQAEVASRVQEMITARQRVEDASDKLKTQLAEICDLGNASLRPLNQPEVPDYKATEKAAVDAALKYRPEFEEIHWAYETQNVNVAVAKNSTLPSLNLTAGIGGAGIGQGNGTTVDRAFDGQANNSNVGLQFNYPLQNRNARYKFQEALKSRDSVAIMMQELRDEVVRQTRTAVRALDADRIKIKVGAAVVEFNKAKVETGLARQQAGLATSFEVLSFQNDLAQARLSLLASIIDYNKAIVLVEQSKGTLLKMLGIDVVDGLAVKTGKGIDLNKAYKTPGKSSDKASEMAVKVGAQSIGQTGTKTKSN